MADVKRSVVITEAQDRFITELARRRERNRSWVVRHALARLMDEAPFSLPAAPTQSESNGYTEQDAAPAAR